MDSFIFNFIKKLSSVVIMLEKKAESKNKWVLKIQGSVCVCFIE